jgi:membrane protein YqaA with SNARE-associated domain
VVKLKIDRSIAIPAAILVALLVLSVYLYLNFKNPYILLFFTGFGFNLIPFAGPSTLLIASNAAIILDTSNPFTLITIGFVIAISAALAKGVHYMVTFFVSGHLSEKRRQRLDTDAAKVRKWAFALLFIAAASPIPDEPIVIPLGLMKYSPVKFFTSYFLGKLSITVAGAFLGQEASNLFSGWLSPEAMVVISIVLTIVITVILLKVDVGKLAEKYLHKKPKAEAQQQKPK